MKWRAYPADVLPAFVAEMDFDLAEPIVAAATAAIAAGDCGYGHKGQLGDAFAAFAGKRLGWSPDPSLIFAIPEVMTGVAEFVQAVTPPGAGIVINPPVYPPFFDRLRLADRQIVEAPLSRADDGRYDLDPEALDQALAGDGVHAYLLCNPHNPTGRVWSASFLAWLDCRALGLGDDPAKAFLDRGRVALSPGPDFGAQGRGFARLNMGTSPELMAEAVRRMAAAI